MLIPMWVLDIVLIAACAVVLGMPFVVLLAIELRRARLEREDKAPAIRLSLNPADVIAIEQNIGTACEYCANGVHEMPGQFCDCACHGRR